MKYQIITDSACDFNEELLAKNKIPKIPFYINIDEEEIIDDENGDVAKFVDTMKASSSYPKTACPSPIDYINQFSKDADVIFIITITAKLSGSYNSAIVAKKEYESENPNKLVHVFDSKSAGPGQTNILVKLNEMIENDMNVDDIILNMTNYIKEMVTFGILASFDNLVKNGRISALKGTLASVLNMKIMIEAQDGVIIPLEYIRGTKKSFNKLVEMINDKSKNDKFSTFYISNCFADKALQELKTVLQNNFPDKKIVILNTGILTTTYAQPGGLLISF